MKLRSTFCLEANADKTAPRDKWGDCVHDVQGKRGIANAYAICTTSVGTPAKESGDHDGAGIKVDHWFYGAMNRLANAASGKKATGFGETAARILGATLCKTAKECCSSSTVPVVQVAGTKRESSKIPISGTFHFRESAGGKDNMSFRVVMIEEGLGNFGDAYYYTRDALESAVDIFEGLKIMADHPSAEEEQIRPERSTRDILGHYEECEVQDGDGGQAQLCSNLVTVPGQPFDWARALMVQAIENAKKFPDKPFIGLSINASGDAEPMDIDQVIAMAPPGARAKLEEAKSQGIETVKVVHAIHSARSCDLVTEAGAGGKILNTIKGDSNGEASKKAG